MRLIDISQNTKLKIVSGYENDSWIQFHPPLYNEFWCMHFYRKAEMK